MTFHISVARYMLSVARPSVSPSVTRVDQSKTVKLSCNFHHNLGQSV